MNLNFSQCTVHVTENTQQQKPEESHEPIQVTQEELEAGYDFWREAVYNQETMEGLGQWLSKNRGLFE